MNEQFNTKRSTKRKLTTSTSECSEQTAVVMDEAEFVPTPLFENVKTLIENPGFKQSVCFVGAKGVGKSTMLRALYARANFEDESKAFFDLLNSRDVTRLVMKVEGLMDNAYKRTKGSKSSLLFIDNIQKAPLSNALVSMVNMFVKQPNTYSWLARLICATSRDGLIRLKDAPGIRLNSNDFHVTVVNPVQIVAEKIITRAENALLTQHTAETVTFLKYFGFVPGIATKFVRYLKVQPGGGSRTLEDEIEKFKKNESAALRQIMTDDISENKHRSDAYTQAIVLCMVDGLTPYQLSDWFFRVKQWLAWTFLKQEEELGKITAVSPFSVEVVRDFLVKDDATLMNTLRFIKACNAEGEGVVCGRAFEKLVTWALAKAPVKKLMLLNHTETPEEIDVLPKTITKTQERTGRLPSDFTPEGNTCYVFKGAEGVDIILSLETEVYFIQCTVSKTLVSSKKSFWKTAREGWKCVLLTPYDAADLKDHFKKYKSDLGTDFKNGEFYVSDASSILSATEIEAFKGDIKL